MPGPMGGGRGGGFSGGSRGGGFRGGGMHHGPHHHGPHHHHHGPIFWGPMFHRPHHHHYGGGCLGSIISSVIVIPILFIFFGLMLLTMCTGDFQDITYDEAVFQDYANTQYEAAFADTEDYEGNVLIVFLVYEGYDGYYYCIPWGGFNIDETTEELFGSRFESIVKNSIPDCYENALTKSFRSIINKMTNEAPENADAGDVETKYSVLHNYSDIYIDDEIVNGALKEFTEKTGYPISIVVEDGAKVFADDKNKDDSNNWILPLVLLLIVGIPFAVIAISKSKGGKKEKDNTDKTDPDAGQGTYDPNSGTWK